MKPFIWDSKTKYEDIPKGLRKLMPPGTSLDALDEVNQIEHVRYRVLHERDIHEEEGPEESGMTATQYRKAGEFLELTDPKHRPTKHGGARKGAGRKPGTTKADSRKQHQFRLNDKEMELIEKAIQIRGGDFSKFVRDAALDLAKYWIEKGGE